MTLLDSIPIVLALASFIARAPQAIPAWVFGAGLGVCVGAVVMLRRNKGNGGDNDR